MRSAGLRIVTAVKNRCSLTSWNIGQPPADPGQPPEDTPSTARPDTGCHWRCKRVSCQRGKRLGSPMSASEAPLQSSASVLSPEYVRCAGRA